MNKIAKRYTFAGLPIAVENPAGSDRVWPGDGGVERKTSMRHDYGFIEDTEGVDGDEVDCYIGPNALARFAFVIHQLQRPGYDAPDEDKVFLGFDSEADAKAAFVAHRDDGDLAYGGMSAIPIGDFVRKMKNRTGAGKIRHEASAVEMSDAWMGSLVRQLQHKAEQRVAMDALSILEVSIGRSLAFDAGGGGGQVRSCIWDRGMTFGEKVKDGQRSEFSVDSFNQFTDNWLKRGEKISLCYNHQSAYVAQNGQPAPALAQYDAIAMVQGGRVIRFTKLHASVAVEPSVLELEQRVAALATDLDPQPTPDGLWFFRASVTELGQQLLPNFSYISPMFTATGKDEQGNDQGYTLIDLAATNTAFQAGCVISFGREAQKPQHTENHGFSTRHPKGRNTMAKTALHKFIKFEDSDKDETVKQAVLSKMEEEAKSAMEGDEGYNYDDAAGRLEEMAKAYEDAKLEDKDDDEAPHVAMRRYAAKFRRMGAPKETPALEGGKDEKEKEAFERAKVAELSVFAQRMGVAVKPGDSSRQIMDAISASTVPSSNLPKLIDARVTEALAAAKAKETAQTYEQRARELAEGLTSMSKEQKDSFVRYAADPQNFEAAKEIVRIHIGAQPDATVLMSRMTGAGAPLGVNPIAARSSAPAAGSDSRIVSMEVLGQGGRALVTGEKLADQVRAMADSVDPAVSARIDRELPPMVKGTQFEAYERYQAATRLLQKDNPALFEAAKTDRISIY